MLRLLAALSLLVAFTLACAFAWVNDAPVRIDLFARVVELPLTHALFAALAAGWLLGVASGLSLLLRQRRELARERARVARAESELDGLRRSLAAGDGR